MRASRIRIVVVSFVTLLVASGVHLSFGLFVTPLSAEFGVGRAAVSLAATVNLVLFGAAQPFFGRLIDMAGPRRTILVGLGLMALGNLATSQAGALWHLYVSYGVLAGAGFAAASILPFSVLILRWFGPRRAGVLTTISTGTSLGQALAYQVASWLILTQGWRATSAVFGTLLAVLVPVGFWLIRDQPPGTAAPSPKTPTPPPGAGHAGERRLGQPAGGLREVVAGRPFRMLTGAYLACGFTDFMITTHLAPLAVDRGLGPVTGARALSILAVANVVGLLLAGRLAGRLGNRLTLVVTYVVRAVAFTFLPFVGGATGLYAFAVVFGLTFFTTAPLTSALISELYGLALTGRVFGAANAVHHLAGAAGAYLAGLVFDATGSYLPVFVLGAVMVYAAAALTWRLAEPTPPGRPGP